MMSARDKYRRWIKISRYISIISFILLVAFIWDEEMVLFAFFLIVFLASIIAPIDFKDKIDRPFFFTKEAVRNRREWAKESTSYRKPLGYTRNFKISLGITVLILLLTVVTWMDRVWPILVLLFSSAITFMLYLTDVKGKREF